MALRLARKDSVETKRGWQLDMNHANSRKVNERKRMVSHITKDDSTSDNTVLLLHWQTNGDMYKKKEKKGNWTYGDAESWLESAYNKKQDTPFEVEKRTRVISECRRNESVQKSKWNCSRNNGISNFLQPMSRLLVARTYCICTAGSYSASIVSPLRLVSYKT